MKVNLENVRLVVTHPGVFHADDVIAVALLACLTSGTENDAVQRRVPTVEELEDPTVLVLDVGGRHNPSLRNFDHHQVGGAGWRDNGVPYASAGLILSWIISMVEADTTLSAAEKACWLKVLNRLDQQLVQPIDAADCGWGTLEGSRPAVSLSAALAVLNPQAGASADMRDERFQEAVTIATRLVGAFLEAAAAHVEAEEEVLGSHATMEGKVLLLNRFVPWTEHVFSRENQGDLLYVLFPSERGGYCVQQVPIKPGSFAGRKPLPQAWAGLRGEALAKVTGLGTYGDATFAHPGGFIAGAETLADALQLARLAVDDQGFTPCRGV